MGAFTWAGSKNGPSPELSQSGVQHLKDQFKVFIPGAK